jgi:hypothetical protein
MSGINLFNVKTWGIGIAIGALWLATAGSAHAIRIDFDPASQISPVPGSVSVDVIVSELAGEIVSAYDLDVTYDDSVLSATGITLTSALGEAFFFEAFYDSDLGTSGIVDFAGLSLLSDFALLALQGGDSVLLATITFDVIAPGPGLLGFTFDAFNDIKGAGGLVLDVEPGTGVVNTSSQQPIPEPGSLLMFAVGAVITGSAIRHRAARAG